MYRSGWDPIRFLKFLVVQYREISDICIRIITYIRIRFILTKWDIYIRLHIHIHDFINIRIRAKQRGCDRYYNLYYRACMYFSYILCSYTLQIYNVSFKSYNLMIFAERERKCVCMCKQEALCVAKLAFFSLNFIS